MKAVRIVAACFVAAVAAAVATPIFVALVGLASWGPEGRVLWHFVIAAIVLGSTLGSAVAVGITNVVFGTQLHWWRVAVGMALGLGSLVLTLQLLPAPLQAVVLNRLVVIAAVTCVATAIGSTFRWKDGTRC